MKNILIRALSGSVYVALIVVCLLCKQYWAFPALCAIFAFAGILEFQRMVQPDFFASPQSIFVDLLIGLLIIALIPVALYRFFAPEAFILPLALGILILLRLVMQLYSHNPHPVRRIAFSALSVIYVALPLAAALLIAYIFGPALMLLIFIMIWLNDTGAFLVGSAIGSHHLFRRLSPKKSWEGFFGGLAFCIAAGYLATPIAPAEFQEVGNWWLMGRRSRPPHPPRR